MERIPGVTPRVRREIFRENPDVTPKGITYVTSEFFEDETSKSSSILLEYFTIEFLMELSVKLLN